MKKLIAILTIAIVLVGAVFALTNDTLTLSSTVGEIKPNFILDTVTDTGTRSGQTIATNVDISIDNITWTFKIVQDGSIRGTGNNAEEVDFSRYKGEITLTVEIGPFKTAGGNGIPATTSEATYKIVSSAKGSDVNGKLETFAGTITSTGDKKDHEVVFKPVFKGGKLEDDDANNIGTFTATWNADDTLPSDGSTVYTADIVLTYTVS